MTTKPTTKKTVAKKAPVKKSGAKKATRSGDAATLARLHERLVAQAAEADLLDIACRTVDSPFGSLLVAATPVGIVRVAFECEDHDSVLDALAATVSPRILAAPRRLDGVARELNEYFAGRRREFDLAVDLRLVRGFRRSVIEHLTDIEFGTTATYSQLAALAGSPAAVRAAGSACANNPVPIVVPCHRVVRSDGSVGQYLGGTEAKQSLLRLEAA